MSRVADVFAEAVRAGGVRVCPGRVAGRVSLSPLVPPSESPGSGSVPVSVTVPVERLSQLVEPLVGTSGWLSLLGGPWSGAARVGSSGSEPVWASFQVDQGGPCGVLRFAPPAVLDEAVLVGAWSVVSVGSSGVCPVVPAVLDAGVRARLDRWLPQWLLFAVDGVFSGVFADPVDGPVAVVMVRWPASDSATLVAFAPGCSGVPGQVAAGSAPGPDGVGSEWSSRALSGGGSCVTFYVPVAASSVDGSLPGGVDDLEVVFQSPGGKGAWGQFVEGSWVSTGVPPASFAQFRFVADQAWSSGLPVDVDAVSFGFPESWRCTVVRSGELLVEVASAGGGDAAGGDGSSVTGVSAGLSPRERWCAESEVLLQAGPVAVLVARLEGLATVRRTFGFATADRVAAAALEQVCAVVDPSAAVAWLEPDSVSVATGGLLSLVQVDELARRVAEALLVPLPSGSPQAFHVSPSVGFSVAPLHGRTVEDLLHKATVSAEVALSSPGRAVRWDPQLVQESDRHAELLAELSVQLCSQIRPLANASLSSGSLSGSAGVSGGRLRPDRPNGADNGGDPVAGGAATGLFLEFQAKVSLESSGPVLAGVEALARWRHPTRGLVPPSQFVPLVESSALAARFTSWVLAEALGQFAAVFGGSAAPSMRLSVNVPPQLVADGGFVDLVSDALLEAGADPQWLMLEVTERRLVSSPQLKESLTRLRSLSVAVSVDDFGAGATSVSLLRRLPVDEVKIDRSFVRGVHKDPAHRAVLAALGQLGRALGVVVCAEGVELPEEVQVLSELQIPLAQGFAFSRPGRLVDVLGQFSSSVSS